ncbi:MAG: hypothetical protein M5U10_10865 [Candidatus Methanoperedens sp.]|nr:hypothetical protein [Candidatus Methanoperedens sp.]
MYQWQKREVLPPVILIICAAEIADKILVAQFREIAPWIKYQVAILTIQIQVISIFSIFSDGSHNDPTWQLHLIK